MKNTSVIVALTAMALSLGCATKSYVRQQTTPLINKTNELDDLTAQNTKAINEVNARAQAGIQQVEATATAADQQALAAGQKANQAQADANNAAKRVDTLQTAVANLDNYHVSNEISVLFGINRDGLTKNAKAALDQLVATAANVKDYIVVVQGFTDSTGGPNYNFSLSRRRADAVIQYLAAEHTIPAYKIYMIGLGEDNPVSSNKTSAGRSQNRRAEVKLMTNAVEGTTSTAASSMVQ